LLGLPPVIGISLIVGFLRKELAVLLLVALLGTANIPEALTPLQIMVFTLVSIFYVPCAATFAALQREFGMKRAVAVAAGEVALAIAIGALALRLLPLAGILPP
jgi:ferrous iron transport protein B